MLICSVDNPSAAWGESYSTQLTAARFRHQLHLKQHPQTDVHRRLGRVRDSKM